MAWNDQIPPLILPPQIESGNADGVTTGIPELDEAIEYLSRQAKANSDRTDSNLQKIADAVGQIGASFERYGSSVNRVVNGQIEFPTPYATEHTGNIKCTFVNVTTQGNGGGNWMAIPHGYGDGVQGQIPRGWFQISNSFASSSARFLDQLCTSIDASPFYSTVSYSGCTITSATSITGTPAGANGWRYQGVQAGDQFKAFKAQTGTGTINPVTGDTTVTGTGTLFTTEAKVGWLVRMTGAAKDIVWRRIESITSDTSMVVAPAFFQTEGAARNIEFFTFDRTWCDISAITTGASDVLTLNGTGSEVASGTIGCDYVIRRPADSTYIYVRYKGSNPTETTLAVF